MQTLNYISGKCREMARVVQAATAINPAYGSMEFLTDPTNWKIFMKAVKDATRYDIEAVLFGVPSLARKTGYTLPNMIALEISAIMRKDSARLKDLGSMRKLVAGDF